MCYYLMVDMIRKDVKEQFVFERVLSADAEHKMISILGHLKGEDEEKKIIMRLEKPAFE